MPHTSDESHKGGKASSVFVSTGLGARGTDELTISSQNFFHLVISKTFEYRAMMCRMRRMLSLRGGFKQRRYRIATVKNADEAGGNAIIVNPAAYVVGRRAVAVFACVRIDPARYAELLEQKVE